MTTPDPTDAMQPPPSPTNTINDSAVRVGRAAALFTDARTLHAAALDRLSAGDIRDAAEKAWCATKRAADGLVTARTGTEPAKSPITTRELRRLARADRSVGPLTDHYHTARDVLHGDCFYLGLCEPADIELLINETGDYIIATERLAAP